jgi:DNA-binding beta-propeller fold protein YncE
MMSSRVADPWVIRIGVLFVAAVVIVSLAWATSETADGPTVVTRLDAPINLDVNRVATELQNPRGVAVFPDGRLLVVEAGNGIETDDSSLETGRVSIFEDLNQDGDFDDSGEITPLFSQIPSYNTLTAFGTGNDEVGGAGDVVLLDDGRFFFTRDDPSVGYAADGSPRGINVVEVAADFVMQGNLVVRNATLNALTFDPSSELFYVVESGANRVISVTMDGTVTALADFGELEQGQQAVPAGIALDPTTGDILVALFSGQLGDYFGGLLTFMPGSSKIVRIDTESGEQQDAITGLTTGVDVAVDEAGNIFVVELTSRWPASRMPRDFDLFDPDAPPDPGGYQRYSGSVTMYPADGSAPVRLIDGLDSPTNITYANGELYVSLGQGTPGRTVIGPEGATQIVGEIYRLTDFLP